jgi:antitoxin component HigA of HigAB toxin-antitoxin module
MQSEERTGQLQQTLEKIDEAIAWVKRAELNAKVRLEELENSFPHLLADRALGEVTRDEVAGHRDSITYLRKSVAECALASSALERRWNAAHDELKRLSNEPGKNESPGKELATTNEDGDKEPGTPLMSPHELKAQIQSRGLSVNKFSQLLGCSQSFLSKVFAGKKKLPEAMARKASEVLEI